MEINGAQTFMYCIGFSLPLFYHLSEGKLKSYIFLYNEKYTRLFTIY